ITALCRIRWLAVIPRGQGAGAQYQLQGSVRDAGERVRISAHLIETATGVCLWSQAYDRSIRERLAVQEEIAGRVTAAIEGQVVAAEGARALLHPDEGLLPWEVVARARAHFAKVTKADAAKAIALLTGLLAAHPDCGPAHSLLGFCLVNAAHMGWIARADGLPFGREHAIEALALDEGDPWAHIALGYWAMME